MIYLRAGSFDLGSNTCSQRLFETPRIEEQKKLEQRVKDARSDENGNWTDFAGNNLGVDDANSVSRLPVPIG